MRAVNLLPRNEARSGPGLPSPWVLLAAAVPVVAGSLVYLGYSTEQAKVAGKRAELAAVQAQLNRFTAKREGLLAQSDLVGLRATRQTALQDALSKSMAWEMMLQDLARVLPKGISLTNLSAQSPTPSAARATFSPTSTATSSTTASSTTPIPPVATPPPTSFMIQGNAGTHDQIAQLLERLSLLPMLSSVTLTSTSTLSSNNTPGTKAGPPQIQFSVSAGVMALPQGTAP